MKKIDEIIKEAKKQNRKVYRIKYQPYSFEIAKIVWYKLATGLIGDIEICEQNKLIWNELIKYVHGDESSIYDINKTICLMGRTGSGKSKTMQIMQKYIAIDDVKFVRREKVISFSYNIISARYILDQYCTNGYDGIWNFEHFSNICIDDLGSEPKEGLYFGTRLNVLNEIIERRYEKGLTTHFTTNLDELGINDNYNDRVYSRIKENCNMIVMNDKDFRI